MEPAQRESRTPGCPLLEARGATPAFALPLHSQQQWEHSWVFGVWAEVVLPAMRSQGNCVRGHAVPLPPRPPICVSPNSSLGVSGGGERVHAAAPIIHHWTGQNSTRLHFSFCCQQQRLLLKNCTSQERANFGPPTKLKPFCEPCTSAVCRCQAGVRCQLRAQPMRDRGVPGRDPGRDPSPPRPSVPPTCA